MSCSTGQSVLKRLLVTVLGLLCTHVCCVTGMEVSQSPPDLSLQEGASCMLRCSFSTSVNRVQWFRQNPGGHLISLFYIPSGTKQNGRLSATTVAKDRYSLLNISSSQTTDSAIYFCAATRDHSGNRPVFGKGTRLSVIATIENPDPAVYELKNPKSGKSVCLFTDFDSQDNEKQTMEHSMIKLDSTVLDMKTMDSKSNGALAWNDSFNLGCNSAFNKPYHSSSEFPCDAKLVEKGFETDMNLNFHNLMVIMLRILFLKVVGFNLLMTLRLWSS